MFGELVLDGGAFAELLSNSAFVPGCNTTLQPVRACCEGKLTNWFLPELLLHHHGCFHCIVS